MMKKSPHPTVKIRGKYLHSPYDPLREAEKLTSRENYSDKTHIILFEPGLGYGAELLLERYPRLRLLIISPLDLLTDKLKRDERVAFWLNNGERGLQAFLSEHIHESDLNYLAYLPWPPSVRILPEEAAETGKAIGDFLKRLRANHAHVSGFGRKNLRNSLINYLTCSPARLPRLQGLPVIVAASGPSLEKNLASLRKRASGYFIISLPSAVRALKAADISPQLILSTDPGYWAARHFRHFPDDIPVGLGLNGNCLKKKAAASHILFNQQSFLDNALLNDLKLPVIPSTGSVALSALEFVRVMGAESLTFAGLDLCMKDIKSHTSPHSFDNLLQAQSSRLHPLHQIYFSRVSAMTAYRKGQLRFGYALEQYKAWLESRNDRLPLYRLDSETPSLGGVREIANLPEKPKIRPQWTEIPYPGLSERKKKARVLLSLWMKEAEKSLGSPASLTSSEQGAFSDFLYTLIPEEFSLLKKNTILGKEINGVRNNAEDKIMSILRESEELCERLSL